MASLFYLYSSPRPMRAEGLKQSFRNDFSKVSHLKEVNGELALDKLISSLASSQSLSSNLFYLSSFSFPPFVNIKLT